MNRNIESANFKANQLVMNKKLYQEFLSYLEDQVNIKVIKDSTCKSYSEEIFKLLMHFDNIDFKDLEKEQIEDYFLNKDWKDRTANRILAAIQYFILFADERYSIKLSKNSIEHLKKRNKEMTSSNNESPLTIDEIITLRNWLKQEGEYRLLLFFELAYVYGLKLEEIEKCNEDNYDFQMHTFRFDNKQIKVNHELADILMDIRKPLKKVGRTTVHNEFVKMGTPIGRKMSWADVNATWKMLPECPNCRNEKFPLESEYWFYIMRSDDVSETKWLVCKSCYERAGGRTHESLY